MSRAGGRGSERRNGRDRKGGRLGRTGLGALIVAAAFAGAMPASAGHTDAPAAPAQPAAAEHWTVSDRRVAFAPARLAFPLRAGALEALRHEELSATGQHIDNAIQYRSADRQIIGTIYIYRPGLPHAGVAALGTDEALRVTSEAPVEAGAWRTVTRGRDAESSP